MELDPKTLKINVKPCGTQGCAMGELPIVFPKDWVYPEPSFCVEGDRIVVNLPSAPELVDGDSWNNNLSRGGSYPNLPPKEYSGRY